MSGNAHPLFKTLLLTLVIIAAFVGGVFLTKPASCGAFCPEPVIQTVTASEFSALVSGHRAVILDVRTPVEFAAGHITAAVNLDISNPVQFENDLLPLDKTRPYLVYCRSGNRSARALKLMSEKGFTHVTNLSGGLLAWQAAGLPVTK